jgi:RHS repeat-associated protein
VAYGFEGEPIAECAAPNGANPATKSPMKEYAYRAGEMLIQADASDCKWLVSDHLGSPRIILGKSGSLADTRRRDFMPFGEDLGAGQFGRTTAQGCEPSGTPSNPREKFAACERDDETGLDFAQARYYQSKLGRFTSVDPLLSSGNIYAPQTWNRFSYSLNNPLKYTDSSGMYVFADGVDEKYKKQFRQGLKDLKSARDSFNKKSDEYKALDRALNAYGKEGVNNGVTIVFGANKDGAPAATSIGIKADSTGAKLTTVDNPAGQNTVVIIDPMQNKSADDYVLNIGHEGSHVADGSDLVGALPNDLASPATQTVLNDALNLTKYVTEKRAYEVTAFIAQGRGADALTVGTGKYEIWNVGWSQADRAAKRSAGIDKVLADPSGYYKVTPEKEKQGKKLIE